MTNFRNSFQNVVGLSFIPVILSAVAWGREDRTLFVPFPKRFPCAGAIPLKRLHFFYADAVQPLQGNGTRLSEPSALSPERVSK